LTRPRKSDTPAPVSSFDVVAITASAGGLNAINSVLSNFPASFPATVVVVQHLDQRHRSGVVLVMEEQPEGNEHAK